MKRSRSSDRLPEGSVSLSILIPTIGRPELGRILGELSPQLSGEDEILVIGDGPQPEAAKTVSGLDDRVRYLEHGPEHCWGHPQRNWAMPQAKGDYLMSFDDDDRCAPTALRDVRRAALDHPGRPLMFRQFHEGRLIWSCESVEMGNVSTQIFATPNVPRQLGQWGLRYPGDFDFIASTLHLYPGADRALVWRREVIAVHGTLASKDLVDRWTWDPA